MDAVPGARRCAFGELVVGSDGLTPTYESLGGLGQRGERYFATYSLEEFRIGDHDVKGNFTIAGSFDGSLPRTGITSRTIVVCANTSVDVCDLINRCRPPADDCSDLVGTPTPPPPSVAAKSIPPMTASDVAFRSVRPVVPEFSQTIGLAVSRMTPCPLVAA